MVGDGRTAREDNGFVLFEPSWDSLAGSDRDKLQGEEDVEEDDSTKGGEKEDAKEFGECKAGGQDGEDKDGWDIVEEGEQVLNKFMDDQSTIVEQEGPLREIEIDDELILSGMTVTLPCLLLLPVLVLPSLLILPPLSTPPLLLLILLLLMLLLIILLLLLPL